MFKNNDGRSQVIRNLTPEKAHAFLVHPTGTCSDGCDMRADPERLRLYERAHEETHGF